MCEILCFFFFPVYAAMPLSRDRSGRAVVQLVALPLLLSCPGWQTMRQLPGREAGHAPGLSRDIIVSQTPADDRNKDTGVALPASPNGSSSLAHRRTGRTSHSTDFSHRQKNEKSLQSLILKIIL